MLNTRFKNFEKGLEWTSIIIFTIGVIISGILIYVLSINTSILWTEGSIDKELTGIIGDFFGGVVGTLFALVSVFLFYLAFRNQKKELQTTNDAFINQQFENKFFNLLQNQMELRHTLFYEESYPLNKKCKSIEFLEHIKNRLQQTESSLELLLHKEHTEEVIKEIQFDYLDSYSTIISEPEKKCKIIYKKIYSKYSEKLSHYFRHLHHILLYLKENEEREINLNKLKETEIKKKYKQYANYIQAQLSGAELFLIFYDALFFHKFRKLVRYYKIIENLNVKELLYDVDIDYYGSLENNEEIKELDSLIFETEDEQLEI